MPNFDPQKLAVAFVGVIATLDDANPNPDEQSTFQFLGEILESKGFDKNELIVWQNEDGTSGNVADHSNKTMNYDIAYEAIYGFTEERAGEVHNMLANILTYEGLNADMVNGLQLTLAQVYA